MSAATTPVKYAGQSYLIEFIVATALYVGAIVLRNHAAHANLSPNVVLATKILPILPIWLMLAVVWRYYLRIDEFARKRLLETLAIAFGIASCAITSYALLMDAGLPQLAITWAWPTLAVSWGLTAGIRNIANR